MTSDSLMDRLCRARASGLVEADAELLAEVLWLAALLQDEEKVIQATSQSTRDPAALEAPGSVGTTQPALKLVGTPPSHASPVEAPLGDVRLYPDLAASRPSRTVPASFVHVPAGDPLPQRHQLERALKPFKRRLPSRRDRVLDATATAEQSAERRAITPVYRAGLERWFDVALITDTSDGMHVWKESVKQLQRLLTRHGAFRQVRLWRYAVEGSSLTLTSNNGYGLAPRTIADPGGRRIFIFLTNGTSRDWDNPALVDFVDLLGQRCPTAIIQMMPRRAWAHTTLGDALAQVTSVSAGEATKRLLVHNRLTGAREPAANALTVPVLPMEADAIATWAGILMGSQRASHFAVKLHRRSAADNKQGTRVPGMDPQDFRRENAPTPAKRVRTFHAIASPRAYQLIRLIAGVPLSLPVIRLMQASMDGESKQSELAEVLLSGLIERQSSGEVQVNIDTVQYEFKEGVREALLESLSVDEMRTIDQVVKSIRLQARAFVTLHAGHSPHAFRAMVADAAGQEAILQAAASFLEVSEEIFRKMYPNRDISQVRRVDAPPAQWTASARPSSFYSERRIVAELRASQTLHQTERLTGTLLIYSTESQRTWLIATARALIIVLDDASTRENRTLVQRADSWFDVLPAVATQSAEAASIKFGSPTNPPWYYSPGLFPEPASLEFAVAELAPGGVRGPLPHVGVMAREYERIRDTMRPSDRRTTSMTHLVEDMRRMLALRPFDLSSAVKSTCLGSQLAAVVSLQEHFQPEHAGWLVQLLSADHAFLAFQSAGALLKSISQLDAEERAQLRSDVLSVMKSLRARGLIDSGVHETAADIVSAIEDLEKARLTRSPRRSSVNDGPWRWILVAGTGSKTGTLAARIQFACSALGQELARAGFGLITGGWPGVDELVAKGFAQELGLDDHVLAQRFIQFMTPKQARLSPYGSMATIKPGRAEYSEPIAKCDAVILVGGLGGTLQVAKMADKAGRLVLPLAASGGDAAKFHSLLQYAKLRNENRLNPRELDALARSLSVAVHEAISILKQRLSSDASRHLL